jgi:hypothetical protein
MTGGGSAAAIVSNALSLRDPETMKPPGPGRKRPPMTMHDFEAKHWVIAAVIILLAVGAFAYSWS